MKIHQLLHLLGNNCARLFPDIDVAPEFEDALTLVSGWSLQADADLVLLQRMHETAQPAAREILDALQVALAPVVAARLAELQALREEAERQMAEEHAAKVKAEQEAIAELRKQAEAAREAEMAELEERVYRRVKAEAEQAAKGQG